MLPNTFLKMYPKCVNCKYYLIPKHVSKIDTSIYAQAKCMKFLTFDIKYNIDLYKHYSGDRIHITTVRPDIYQYAYISRGDNEMCGPIGTRFEPK